MFSKPPIEFYFDRRNGRHDITPVSRLYRIGIVNTTSRSIDDVSVKIKRIDDLDPTLLKKGMNPGTRPDLWGQSLLMMHDRSVPLKNSFTLHPKCEQALDFVQAVPSVVAEYKDGKEVLNIGRKIVVWHSARRYWRNSMGGILEDYAMDPQIEGSNFQFILEARVGQTIENALSVHVWFEEKELCIDPEFNAKRDIPKRLREYAVEV